MARNDIREMAQRARKVDVRETTLAAEKKLNDAQAAQYGENVADKSVSASFTSVDGETYTFGLRDKDGAMLPMRSALCVYLSLIEVEKGGSASTVMSAFGVSIEDMEKKQVFPILFKKEEEQNAPSGFTLGADLSGSLDL
tara:strand:+ start:1567 stop:1986 length:420 start_codon:yes stop_codon:yes gene_type:complete